MKKALIIGASGSLAVYFINVIKELDDTTLTLFQRNKNRLPKNLAGNNTVIEGDAINYKDILQAVAGHNIVYVNLAGNPDAMARNMVDAMHEHV